MSEDPSNEEPSLFKRWLSGKRGGGSGGSLLERWSRSLRKKLPKDFHSLEKSLKDGQQLKSFSRYTPGIRWGLLVLGLFLLSDLVSRTIGLWIRPSPVARPKKNAIASARRAAPVEDYDSIIRRNMFNVEGKVPDPFDQGQLDCFSQARPSTQRLQLLGTIVMNDDVHSVALMQDENNPVKTAVSKDDSFFDGKYQMLKIERKRVCYQVKATQDLEYIEIPEEGGLAGGAGREQVTLSATEGIQPVSDNEFVVKQGFLEKNLLNLNEILQTARAVPYIEPGSGKFKGFLIQSIDANSPFAQLGIKQGDILTGVNDIVLDNAGKGLEAFQRLRNSPKVALKVIRGGEERTVSYDVK